MKVSIVIPVYNKTAFISSCIESLLQQDFDDFEIIAVDDGSTDDSGKICDDKAAQDARIRVIHTENGGVTAARRKGVEQAAGEYIMFVDADDQLLPDAIQILYTAITVNHADEVIGRFMPSPPMSLSSAGRVMSMSSLIVGSNGFPQSVMMNFSHSLLALASMQTLPSVPFG